MVLIFETTTGSSLIAVSLMLTKLNNLHHGKKTVFYKKGLPCTFPLTPHQNLPVTGQGHYTDSTCVEVEQMCSIHSLLRVCNIDYTFHITFIT